MKRKIASKSQANKTNSVKREREPVSLKYVFLTAFCSVILMAGFFCAARQHFSSIDYGIKNSKLRKQVDELGSEQRRMLLEKEVALSPGEVKSNARKIGFTELTASNIQSFHADFEPAAAVNANLIVNGEVNSNQKKQDAKVRAAIETGSESPVKSKAKMPITKDVEIRREQKSVVQNEPKVEIADKAITRKRKL